MNKTDSSKLSHLGLTIVSLLLIVVSSSCAPKFVCQDAIGCVNIAPDAPIKIGIMQALSGELKPMGTENTRSVEMVLESMGGKLLDHSVELIKTDAQCSEAVGTTAALEITADAQIVGVIGTTCSSEARGAMPYLSDAGLVMISGSNTFPSLTALNNQKGDDFSLGYFRTAHNDASQGLAAAKFVYNELNLKKAATLRHPTATYSKLLADVFEQSFVELGGEITYRGEINKGDENITPVLEAVAKSGAELVFFPVFHPMGDKIVIQSKDVAGFENIKLLSSDSLLLESYVDSVQEKGVGTYYIVPNMPSSESYQAVVDAYVANYGEQLTTDFYAPTYDATTILFKAIQGVAIVDRDGTIHIGRQALRDYLYQLRDFKGLTGNISCNEFGDCGVPNYKVVLFQDSNAGIDGIMNNVIYLYPDNDQ